MLSIATVALLCADFFGLLVSFFALCIVCDEHLVPAVEVFIVQFEVPEEVAAVTLVAFGSASPELFLNSVSAVAQTSDLSMSAILGSGMIAFGLIPPMCIITAAAHHQAKLKLSPILRETGFYLIGLFVFMGSIHDSRIGTLEALTICSVYVVYAGLVVAMYCRSRHMHALEANHMPLRNAARVQDLEAAAAEHGDSADRAGSGDKRSSGSGGSYTFSPLSTVEDNDHEEVVFSTGAKTSSSSSSVLGRGGGAERPEGRNIYNRAHSRLNSKSLSNENFSDTESGANLTRRGGVAGAGVEGEAGVVGVTGVAGVMRSASFGSSNDGGSSKSNSPRPPSSLMTLPISSGQSRNLTIDVSNSRKMSPPLSSSPPSAGIGTAAAAAGSVHSSNPRIVQIPPSNYEGFIEEDVETPGESSHVPDPAHRVMYALRDAMLHAFYYPLQRVFHIIMPALHPDIPLFITGAHPHSAVAASAVSAATGGTTSFDRDVGAGADSMERLGDASHSIRDDSDTNRDDDPTVAFNDPTGQQQQRVGSAAPLGDLSSGEVDDAVHDIDHSLVPLWRVCLVVVASITAIGVLSTLIVTCCEAIVDHMEVGTATLGATLVAVGSEIPDMVSAIAMARNGFFDGAVAGAIGSQVIDITLGVGMPAILVCLFGNGYLTIAEPQADSLRLLTFLLLAVIVSYVTVTVPVYKLLWQRTWTDVTIVSRSGAMFQMVVWGTMYITFFVVFSLWGKLD